MSPVAEHMKHLNADGFSAFVDNAMSAEERLEAIAHIADCAQCREVIVLLQEAGSIAEPIARPQTQPARKGGYASLIAGVLLALVGVAALAFAVALAFVVKRQSELPQVNVTGLTAPPPAPPPAAPVRERKRPVEPTPNPKPVEPKPAPSVAVPGPAADLPAIPPNIDTFEDSTPEDSRGGWRPSPLPSKLPAIAAVTRVHQKLAADTDGSLFLSADGGGHWRRIPRQWTGTIVRLGTSSGPADGQIKANGTRSDGAAIPSAGRSRFELTTDTGGVWISDDGLHWRVP